MVRPLPTPNVILEAGESSKSFACLEKIITVAMDNQLGRDCTFVALGGGMISDITAFAASVYMRGCKVILIPTTLLAMASSCLGGKTSINFRFAKDIVGTFFPANEVLICTDCLKSLSTKEYMNGFAEVLKHSLLTKDDTLFNIVATKKQKILERDPETLKSIITISLQIKKAYTDNDPYERMGVRAALNLGSTFAYALEGMSRLQWSSGQAVAWGICKAMEASRELGLCTPEFAAGVLKLFAFYGFDVNYRIQRGDWMDYKSQLAKNKRSANGVTTFVLLKNQGEFDIRTIDEDIIKSVVMVPSV
jgi:3-dehydroquinate synthase